MTIAQPAPASPSGNGGIAVRFALAFVSGLVLVIAIGGGALYAYGQQYTGKVLPGVSVGDVDLSGLSPEEARAQLQSTFGTFGDGTITLTGPDGDVTVGYDEIGREPDVDAMVSDALTAGRQGETMVDLLGAPQTALRGISLTPVVRYDETKLADAVADAAAAIDREPVDATLTAEKGEYTTTDSVDGRTVDQAALLATLDAQLSPLDAPAEIDAEIPYTTQVPAFETADATTAIETAGLMAQDLVLTRGDKEWTIKGSKLLPLITFSPTSDGSFVPVVDRDGLKPLLKAVARDVDKAARNATFKLSGSRVVFSKAAKDGKKLDRGATQDAILEAMTNRQAGQADEVLAPVVVAKDAAVTTEFAKRIAPKMKRISKWTTYFPIWDRNGFGQNIWIPARIISGAVVGPGETFSFWDTVGEVTRAKGLYQRRRDHQRQDRAPGRARRRHLLVLHDAVQRGAAGRLQDGRPAQPLLLHRPLPDGPRRHGVQVRLRVEPGHDLDERHEVPGPDPRHQHPQRRLGLRDVLPVQRPDRPQGEHRPGEREQRPPGIRHPGGGLEQALGLVGARREPARRHGGDPDRDRDPQGQGHQPAHLREQLRGRDRRRPVRHRRLSADGAARPPLAWWQTGVVYQVYPRSFADTDGDGVGDLAGVVAHLDHLAWLGVDAVWLSPIFRSPMRDYGYDVADYRDVDPLFGSLADADRLIAEAHARGIRVLLDLVPNHTSSDHEWFLDARSSRTSPHRDWYVWRDPAADGGPPNGMQSQFGGPAWTLDVATNQYWYHSFLPEQPELDWRNPAVRDALLDAMRFWLARGIDGFRDRRPVDDREGRVAVARRPGGARAGRRRPG